MLFRDPKNLRFQRRRIHLRIKPKQSSIIMPQLENHVFPPSVLSQYTIEIHIREVVLSLVGKYFVSFGPPSVMMYILSAFCMLWTHPRSTMNHPEVPNLNVLYQREIYQYYKRKRHFNDWKASAVPLYHTFRQKESLSFEKSSPRYCSGDRTSNQQCPGTVPALFRELETIRHTAIPCPASEISLCSGCPGKKTDRNITILRPAKTAFQPTEALQTIHLSTRHSAVGNSALFPRSWPK